MTGYSGQQINIKRNDGMLINITGGDTAELKQNVEEFIEYVAPLLDTLAEATNAMALVGNILGGRVIQDAGSPAQSGSAPQGQAAAGPAQRTENDKWGNSYEWGHPKAPLTPSGLPAVLKRGKSSAGKAFNRWIDPRSKAIPSVYASGQKQDPPDVWAGDWANGV